MMRANLVECPSPKPEDLLRTPGEASRGEVSTTGPGARPRGLGHSGSGELLEGNLLLTHSAVAEGEGVGDAGEAVALLLFILGPGDPPEGRSLREGETPPSEARASASRREERAA